MRRLTLIPLVLVVCVLGVWTLQRNHVWRSEYSLTEDNVKKAPNRTRALINYAMVCKQIGKPELGLPAFERAITIDPWVAEWFRLSLEAHADGGKVIFEKDLWNRDWRRP